MLYTDNDETTGYDTRINDMFWLHKLYLAIGHIIQIIDVTVTLQT